MRTNLWMVLVVLFATMFVSENVFAGEVNYRIVKGETLNGIAAKFGFLNHKLISKRNKIKNPDKIFYGRTIIIPDRKSTKVVEPTKSAKIENAEEAGKIASVATGPSNTVSDKSVIVNKIEKSEPVVIIGNAQKTDEQTTNKPTENALDVKPATANPPSTSSDESVIPKVLGESNRDLAAKVSSDEKKGDAMAKGDTASTGSPIVEKDKSEKAQDSSVKINLPAPINEQEKNDEKKMAYGGMVRFMYGCTDLSHCKGVKGKLNLFNESTQKANGLFYGAVIEASRLDGYTKDIFEGEIDTVNWQGWGFGFGPSFKYVGGGFGDRKHQWILSMPLWYENRKESVNVSIPDFEYNQDIHKKEKFLLLAPSLEYAVALSQKTIIGAGISARLPIASGATRDNADMPKTNPFSASLDTFVEHMLTEKVATKINLSPIFKQESNGHIYGSGAYVEVKYNDWLAFRVSGNWLWSATDEMNKRGEKNTLTGDAALILNWDNPNRSLK